MIKNVVLFNSGIVAKQVEECKQINDFKTYFLKEQLNELHTYDVEEQERNKKNLQVFAEIDNHLFCVCFYNQIEGLKEYSRKKILKQLTEGFESALKQHKRVSYGMAQYLGLVNEFKANEEYRSQQEYEKHLEHQRLEEEKKQQQEQEFNNKLDKAEKDLLEGKKIDNVSILGLFDKYSIILPLRTRGWVKNKLQYISQTNYNAYSHSTKIFDYVEALVNKLNETRKVEVN